MNRMLFVFSLLVICLWGHSQNTFFKWFDTPGHEIIYDAAQTSEGEYLLVGEKGVDTYPLHSFILKIGTDGSILDEKEIPDTSGFSRIITIDKLPGSVNRFLLTGARDSVSGTNYYSRLFLMIINDSLEIISLKEFFTQKNRRYNPWKTNILSDSMFYLMYQYDTLGKTYFIPDMVVAKFRIPFDSICSFHYQSNSPFFIPQDIIYNNVDSTLKIIYFGKEIQKTASTIQIVKLSKNLNYLSSKPVICDLYINVSANLLNDSVIYTTGGNRTTLTESTKDIGCYLLNDTNGIIKKMEYFNNPDTLLYGGRGGYTLLTDITTSTAFITSIYNFDIDNYPWPIKPSWVQITRTDFDLNIIDHHFFGGDAFYMPFSMRHTSDGGAFITGFRYDHNSQYQHYDVFILKTDSTGQLTDVPEISNGPVSDAILIPTPGTDHCFAIVAQQYPSTHLMMYNINGSLAMDQLIYGHKTKIVTDHLSKGIYLYKFFYGNALIGSGKWIKQ